MTDKPDIELRMLKLQYQTQLLSYEARGLKRSEGQFALFIDMLKANEELKNRVDDLLTDLGRQGEGK